MLLLPHDVNMPSIQLSCSVMSNSLRHCGLQHTRCSCPSPSPGACSLMSLESVMPSNHHILWHSRLLLPSVFPSIRVFSNDSVLHIRWPKYWSISLSISPSNEYPRLISFRADWFDLLAVQGTFNILCILQIRQSPLFGLQETPMAECSQPLFRLLKTCI